MEARALLRHAIQLDPNYAAAYSALAETYHLDVTMGWAQSPAASLSRAGELANKALGLNDSEVRARIILGRIHILFQRYEQAKTEIDRAIAINPSDAHGLAGRGNILMWSGQTDAAIEALELAQRIDPELNAIDRNALSLAYDPKGRYDAAIEQAEPNLSKRKVPISAASCSRRPMLSTTGPMTPRASWPQFAAWTRHSIRRPSGASSEPGRSRAPARRVPQGRPLARRSRPPAVAQKTAKVWE